MSPQHEHGRDDTGSGSGGAFGSGQGHTVSGIPLAFMNISRELEELSIELRELLDKCQEQLSIKRKADQEITRFGWLWLPWLTGNNPIFFTPGGGSAGGATTGDLQTGPGDLF